jgi:hypothetical protein
MSFVTWIFKIKFHSFHLEGSKESHLIRNSKGSPPLKVGASPRKAASQIRNDAKGIILPRMIDILIRDMSPPKYAQSTAKQNCTSSLI